MIGVRWTDFTRGDDFQVADVAGIREAMCAAGEGDVSFYSEGRVVNADGRVIAVGLIPLREVVGVEDNPGGLFPSLRLACGHKVAMLNPWKPKGVRCWACAEGRLAS